MLKAMTLRAAALFHLSAPASLAGAAGFAAALTPSLVPRSALMQGLLAGLSFSACYFLIVLVLMAWRLLGLRLPQGRGARLARRCAWLAALLIMLCALAFVREGQNELRALMGLAPVESIRPLTIALSAGLVIFTLIWLGRLFRSATLLIQKRLLPLLPERAALLLGLLGALFGFNLLGNDLLLRQALSAFDRSYALLDRALSDSDDAPAQSEKTGGPGSVVPWESLGAEGRRRVSDPLDAAAIAAITGAAAREPVRIYVGLASAQSPEARARLALEEAIRVKAFERKRLVIATPTGTGWVDPAAMVPLEVITQGDVATVSVQYSYLPSWLALLTVQDYGVQTARATFSLFHHHWLSLPEGQRPELWLFGLSLGALHSDLSADLYDLLGAPYSGAYRVGPPFAGQSWQHLTRDRRPDSPAWRPEVRDGRVVRFLNQTHELPVPEAAPSWGPVRILYLQYPSDAITFFSPSLLWRAPDWMAQSPRGADVPRALTWIPVVSFLQIGFDLITATTTPAGFGHVYAAHDYLYGWQALFAPDGRLSPEARGRLTTLLETRGL